MRTPPRTTSLQITLGVLLAAALSPGMRAQDMSADSTARTVEVLPFAVYDTDIGLGAGVKGKWTEHGPTPLSVDLTLFASTKGERWGRAEFSLPDQESRQGTAYPAAVDAVIDYDRMNRASYFGVGNTSRFDQREYYTRVPVEISVLLSRGCSRVVVAQSGLRFTGVRSTNFDEAGSLASDPRNAASTWSIAAVAGVRVDSRDSYIHTHSGAVLQLDLQAAPPLGGTSVDWLRGTIWLQGYHPLWSGDRPWEGAVLAGRAGFQAIAGGGVPIQALLPIGGNRTVRGIPQDRYLDHTAVVCNAELRLPLWWRFGCMLGGDVGKVWARPGDMDLRNWAVSPVAGLRYAFDTFIVRLDAGVSRETFGVYFNFGQVF